MSEEKIKAAACQTKTGDIYWLEPPARHHEVLRFMVEGEEPCSREQVLTSRQGFITTDERFVTRLAAMPIAVAAGQLLDKNTFHPTDLFSEDLW